MSDVTAQTQGFIGAEEAAERLAKSLKRLNVEAENYTSAGKTLDQVATEVRELAARTSEAAALTAEAVEAIRSVGSMQVLEQLQALASLTEANSAAIDVLVTKVDALGEKSLSLEDSVSSVLQKLVALSSELGESAASSAAMVKNTSAATQAEIAGLGVKTKTQIDAVMKAVKNAMYASLAAAVLAAIAAILTRL